MKPYQYRDRRAECVRGRGQGHQSRSHSGSRLQLFPAGQGLRLQDRLPYDARPAKYGEPKPE